MNIENESLNEGRWCTIKEIAELYGKSLTAIRSELRDLDRNDRTLFKKSIGGPKGSTYNLCHYEVSTRLGAIPTQDCEAVRTAFSRSHVKIQIPVAGPETREECPLIGVLESRNAASESYTKIVTEMIRNQRGLRIRAVTATDFFNSHRPTASAFYDRKKKDELDKAKILLLNPFGAGAAIRSAAEGDPNLETSQLRRDAQSTHKYIEDHTKDGRMSVEVRWADQMPYSLLIWTEELALVEPYELNHDPGDSGCVGRKAPLLVVNKDTEYHKTLQLAFDYVFQDMFNLPSKAFKPISVVDKISFYQEGRT